MKTLDLGKDRYIMVEDEKAILYWKGMVANISDGSIDVVGGDVAEKVGVAEKNSGVELIDGAVQSYIAGTLVNGDLFHKINSAYGNSIPSTRLKELSSHSEAEAYVNCFLDKIGLDLMNLYSFSQLPILAKVLICSYFMGDLRSKIFSTDDLKELMESHPMIYEILIGRYSAKTWGKKGKDFSLQRRRLNFDMELIDRAVQSYVDKFKISDRPITLRRKVLYKYNVDFHLRTVKSLRSEKDWEDKMNNVWFS